MPNLYDIYKSGEWVPKDMQKALYYLTMSSEGSSSALNKLGECYFNGIEVPQDYEKAGCKNAKKLCTEGQMV